jgi:hypothetical protein
MGVQLVRLALLILLPGLAAIALQHQPGAGSLSIAGSAIDSIPGARLRWIASSPSTPR